MPELPDIEVYLRRLEERVKGRRLLRVRLGSPFLLRTVTPPLAAVEGKTVERLRRVGKRVAFGFEGDLWLVIHLMISGRLHWKPEPLGAKLPGGKKTLAGFEFDSGSLTLTEASTQKRASLHVVEGEAGLAALDRGGLEPMTATLDQFDAALRRENRTLKRALTDPRLFSGIGNAYSDEILHRAKLSPAKLTSRATPEEAARLFEAVRAVLAEWTERLDRESTGKFPEKVTAFRPEMAVHGRFGKPCPVCGASVQRIVYASNESNYCARCQTEGRLLSDRALARLLREDWPKTLEELEERKTY
jgi:formamidopyrimidine-DNA glycosylase